ncbi:HNH endonuclease [Paenibacillus sp. 1P03SA]|uniref:HNH endonuclease n=1 Tax=Paenibacillus sp. 1P03SA TaxID=3132294 RepID=UPI0039A37856
MKNSIKIVGEKAVIFVPYKDIRVEVLIDAARVPDVVHYKWLVRFNKRGGTPYIAGYRYLGRPGCRLREDVYLHRLLTKAPPGLVVDHINGDTLDNTSENLRVCTPAENHQNITAPPWSRTGVRNVYELSNGKYRVQIGYNGEQHRFGTYDSLYEAAQVAREKRAELHTYSNSLKRTRAVV